MIVVPALHPSREVLVRVDELLPGEVHRTGTTLEMIGGKSINVARFVAAMGGSIRLVALADDAFAARLAADSTLASSAAGRPPIVSVVPSPAASRLDLAIVDARGAVTVVNGTAPAPPPEAVAAVEALTTADLGPGDVLVLAGSLPPGTAGLLARLVGAGRDLGATVIVDASGPWIDEALAAQPHVVKINRAEAAEVRGRGQSARGAGSVPIAGPDVVVVTDGAAGMRAWIDGHEWQVTPPPALEIVNTLGAGDAVTAGLALGLADGRSALDALRLGTAMAAARLRHLALVLHPEDVTRLEEDVGVESAG